MSASPDPGVPEKLHGIMQRAIVDMERVAVEGHTGHVSAEAIVAFAMINATVFAGTDAGQLDLMDIRRQVIDFMSGQDIRDEFDKIMAGIA